MAYCKLHIMLAVVLFILEIRCWLYHVPLGLVRGKLLRCWTLLHRCEISRTRHVLVARPALRQVILHSPWFVV